METFELFIEGYPKASLGSKAVYLSKVVSGIWFISLTIEPTLQVLTFIWSLTVTYIVQLFLL